MSRLSHRFISFLDRFEDRLEVDCERLKRQLVAQVNQQFGVLRTKVYEIRNSFGGLSGQARSSNIDGQFDLLFDDPAVVIGSHDEWIQERNAISMHQPSTSSGRKRKMQSQPSTLKKGKTSSTVDAANKKHVCKYEGCGRAFMSDHDLARHERIHLGIKPFSCSLPNCRYSAEQRGPVTRHIREKHFKLPRTNKSSQNIVDNCDPNQYVKVDNDLLERRL